MSLREEITAQYARHGSRHILPFIGSAYEETTTSIRVLALAFNAYVSDGDWPAHDAELQEWYPGWWAAAGHEQTPRFFDRAYEQCTHLACELMASPFLDGLSCDLEPETKSGLYGTNAMKVFMEERYKASDALSYEDFQEHAPTWHAELDILAKYQRFPHLIVVFGQAIWDHAWRAFYRYDQSTFPRYSSLKVIEYVTCGAEDSPCYHHANRITVQTGTTRQNVLLVRVHHPSARSLPRRDSTWLLEQQDFRELAQLRTLRA